MLHKTLLNKDTVGKLWRRPNKDIDKNKVCKVGLSLRRGNVNLEG